MSEPLAVHLYDTTVGWLHPARNGQVDFETSSEAIKRFDLSSPTLSASLPFSARRSGVDAATAFFGGLLPEGRGLTNLAKQAGCSSDDVFALIDYAGRDVAGAVVIGGPADQAPRYEVLSASSIRQRMDRVNDYALGAMGGGGSLAGYQPKTTLARIKGQWHAGLNGAASTHILKPLAAESEPALHIEAYTLDLARTIGLTNFDSWIERFEDRPVLVIERYDRIVFPDGSIDRIHQEDAAQALGLPWRGDAKFESIDKRAHLRNVAGLLSRRRTVFGGGQDDREMLLAYTAFNVAVGNTDAHAKNFSTLHHVDGAVTLAPLYDISTHALAADGNQNMSMRIAGKHYQPDITREDLVTEAVSWGLTERDSSKVIDSILEQLRYAIEDVDPGEAPERVGNYIAVQAQNLLDGRRAALDDSGPPSLARISPPAPIVRRADRTHIGHGQ